MDIGDILSTIPPIVENIFIYLNGSELDSCSEVCELWRRVAETEKSRRKDIAWFFQGSKCFLHDKLHPSRRECPLDDISSMEDDLSVQLKSIKMQPYFCLTFATNELINKFKNFFPSFDYTPKPQPKRRREEEVVYRKPYLRAAVNTAVGQYLPEVCKRSFLVAPGIIGSQADGTPFEIEDSFGISGIMIPHVPGLQVYHFNMDEKMYDISKFVPKDTKVKCLLVFHATGPGACFNRLVESCLLRENSRIAVGGALIDRVDGGRNLAIAFCGRSVEAASIIIQAREKESVVETRLRRFQETGLLQDRCFAFMFACVARGYCVHRKYNAESSIFHRLYPDVPLLGAFGSGEIGVDYLPNTPCEKNEVIRIGKLERTRKNFLHTYSSIFVLVSVKL